LQTVDKILLNSTPVQTVANGGQDTADLQPVQTVANGGQRNC
jgi:hypothetical protein